MTNTGFFFSGVTVGVVLAAAFGLDMYPTPAASTGPSVVELKSKIQEAQLEIVRVRNALQSTVDRLESEAADMKDAHAVLLKRAETDRADCQARTQTAQEQVSNLKQKLYDVEGELYRERATTAQLQSQLRQRQKTPGPVLAELQHLRNALRREQLARRSLAADLDTAQKSACNLLKEFFSRRRPPGDAALVRAFLSSAAPTAQKGHLVAYLRQTNPEVLLAIPLRARASLARSHEFD